MACNILVNGVGPYNKGAELMLCAIAEQLRRVLPQARLCVPLGIGDHPWRAEHNLGSALVPLDCTHREWWVQRALNDRIRNHLGLLRERDVHGVLDASGFHFGDNAAPLRYVWAVTRMIERWRRNGAPVILLPQAFGPFRRPAIRYASRRALHAANLVIARDNESHAHAAALLLDSERAKLLLAPDFTNLLHGLLPPGFTPSPRMVGFIPNRKMLSQTAPAVREAYLPLLRRCIRRARDAAFEPLLIVHETRMDRPLCETLAREEQTRLLDDPNPLHIKGVLGACAFVVGSRFHGLISALSQGVPCLGTAWSHKYVHLFQEYGCPELLASPAAPAAQVDALLDRLLDDASRARCAAIVAARAQTLRAQSEAMWADVWRVFLPALEGARS